MFVSKHKNELLCRTPFTDGYDLTQVFRGVTDASENYNYPVDFARAGLIDNTKGDFWHIDIPFAISTDEAPPCFINGEYIGGNHDFFHCVGLVCPNHGKTSRDIGTLWQDKAGVSFTLLAVEEERLVFLSENVGESKDKYAFVAKIEGDITCQDSGETLSPQSQHRSGIPSIRILSKKAVAVTDGVETTVYGSATCDYAEIREEYEIIHPATVAEAVRSARTEEGFFASTRLPEYGEAMLLYRMTYRITSDGTVYCIFNHKKLAPVSFTRCMGAMYQEKIDVYGGGIWRTLPGVKPITTEKGEVDFSKPVWLYDSRYPDHYMVKKEDWVDETQPPHRYVDVFRDKTGKDRLGFACGYMPIYDGVPQKRVTQLAASAVLIKTKKAYPLFAEGELGDIHGVAYKKYFPIGEDGNLSYTVEFEE